MFGALMCPARAAFPTGAVDAQGAPGTMTVRVVGAESQLPLENARVALDPAARESLTGAEGRAVFGSLPGGTYRLSVRRIGYAPADTTLVLADGEQRQV